MGFLQGRPMAGRSTVNSLRAPCASIETVADLADRVRAVEERPETGEIDPHAGHQAGIGRRLAVADDETPADLAQPVFGRRARFAGVRRAEMGDGVGTRAEDAFDQCGCHFRRRRVRRPGATLRRLRRSPACRAHPSR
jgi:hypothetical protein